MRLQEVVHKHVLAVLLLGELSLEEPKPYEEIEERQEDTVSQDADFCFGGYFEVPYKGNYEVGGADADEEYDSDIIKLLCHVTRGHLEQDVGATYS